MAKKKFDTAAEQAKMLKEAQSIGKALGMEYEDIAGIQEDILNGAIKTNKVMLEELKTAKSIRDTKKETLRIDQTAKELVKDLSDIQKTIQGNYKKLFSTSEDIFQVQKDLVKSKQEEVDKSLKEGKINKDIAKSLSDQLKTRMKDLDVQEQLQKKYQSQFDTLTALGGFLKNNLGAVGELLEGSIGKGIEAFSEEMGKSGDAAQASQTAMKAFGGQLSSSLIKMFSLVGIATLLYTALSDALKAVKDFSAATGASIGQSQELVNSAKQYAATSGLTLATAEKTLDVQKQLIAEFGNINSVSTETAAKVAQIGESFGYGAEMAGQVQASMMSIGASAEDAMKIQGFTSALAEAAGVAPGAVMKDIAQNAKATAKYFAGNPKALAKAAVEAARIGLSLNDMASVADKLLDIEGSLTAQFEASAMLGKTINMDKARQLALDGDIEGATKATLEQVGSIADFEKMSMLQRKKIAQAAGMEVSQIEKALQLQEASKNMSAEQQALVAKYGDALGDISKMNEKDILQRTTSLQAADELNATVTQMKDTFTTILVPIATVFANILQSLSPIVKGIMLPFVLISKLIQYISENVSALTGKFEWLSDISTGLSYVLEGIGVLLSTVLIPYMGVLIAKQIQAARAAIATAIPTIYGAFSKLGPVGFIAGGIAAAAMVGIAHQYMDDGVSQPGYGTRVLSSPEGSISLNNKDTVVAGTNLFDAGNNTSNGSSAKVESLLSELISLTRQSISQPVPVVIGDKAVNEIGKQYATNSSYKPAGSR
jgi:hypothetical protein